MRRASGALGSMLFALASASACGGGTTGGAPGADAATQDGTTSDGAGTPADSGTPPSFDASSPCSVPLADLPSYAAPSDGTITGTGLSAAICTGGVYADIFSAGARDDTAPFFFELTWAIQTGNEAPVTDFDFENPADASDGELDVLVGISSAAPGDYTSPAGQECGSMAFTYYLPVPPGVDCDAGTAPNCPQGCSSVCALSCEPCTPQQPSVSYTAKGTTDCLGNSQMTLGVWHLTLTSVALASSGTGQNLTYYTPHGTFTATMLGGSSGTDTATFTVAF